MFKMLIKMKLNNINMETNKMLRIFKIQQYVEKQKNKNMKTSLIISYNKEIKT